MKFLTYFVGLFLTMASLLGQTNITSRNITWTLNGSPTKGQFVSGDWWVVGPVTVTNITRPSNNSGRDGSMINPSPTTENQGFDSRVADYVGSLNVANQLPLTIQPNNSLVSVIGNGPTNQNRTYCGDGEVLTVLNSVPPTDAFRPAYTGTSKPIYRLSQVNKYRLFGNAELDPRTPSNSAPSVAVALSASKLTRPQLDFQNWYVRPFFNLPNGGYGREVMVERGKVELLLLCDSSLINGNKDDLVVGYIQCGIDIDGVIRNGGGFPPDGGTGQGRYMPMLLTGLVLGDSNMVQRAQNAHVNTFHENGQTFYVTQSTISNGNGYTQSDIGLPEWYNKPGIPPSKSWTADDYRRCCTANSWWGSLAAARAHGIVGVWGHQALFDYQDRYKTVQSARSDDSWMLTWDTWIYEMYNKYRYRPVLRQQNAAKINSNWTVECDSNGPTSKTQFWVDVGLHPAAPLQVPGLGELWLLASPGLSPIGTVNGSALPYSVATRTIAIPNDPSLLNQKAYLQAISQVPGGQVELSTKISVVVTQ